MQIGVILSLIGFAFLIFVFYFFVVWINDYKDLDGLSKCCGATVVEKKGETFCLNCGKECEIKSVEKNETE